MPHTIYSPLLPPLDSPCLSKEIVQLRRQVIELETERKQLLAENALLRLRLYSSSICFQEPPRSILKEKKELKQLSVRLCDSQSKSVVPNSLPPLDGALVYKHNRFGFRLTHQALFEKLSVQCDLLNKALSDIDILSQSFKELERTSQHWELTLQQLLIELLFRRKQVRTLHAENQAKNNLLRMVSTTHSETKQLLKASHEEITRRLLVQLLMFRKDIINRQVLMAAASSSGTSAITHASSDSSSSEITELDILRLSEAELRAEKESLVTSLKELLDVIVFRNPFSNYGSQQLDDSPITELVLALVYAWKSSRQKSITCQQNKTAASKNPIHAVDAIYSRSTKRCIITSRYKPPHRRDVESKTSCPSPQLLLANPDGSGISRSKSITKSSDVTSPGGSILRFGASSFAHVKLVPVKSTSNLKPRKVVESSSMTPSVVQQSGLTYLRWRAFS